MEGVGIQIFTLVLAGFYCVVFHAFRTADSDNRTARERYTRMALVLAALTSGLAAAKASGEMVVALAGVSGAAIVLLQGLVIRAAGVVTLKKDLSAALVETKRWTIAMSSLVGAPMILLFTGAHPLRDEVLTYLIAAEAITLSILFLVRTLRLFVRQKVSVLVWILYLCGVEVVPAWAVIVLAVRIV